MSTTATFEAHVAYELVHDRDPAVVVLEVVNDDLASPSLAHEFGEQLECYVRPEFPHRFVIDFANVRTVGSTAFGELVSFARQVGRLVICNLATNLRLGASLADLDLYAEFAPSRRAAIDIARRGPMRGDEETVDYPAWRTDSESMFRDSSAHKKARAGNSSKRISARPSKRRSSSATRPTLDDFGGRSDALGG
jgi:anti-anti-sigma regulatory factor